MGNFNILSLFDLADVEETVPRYPRGEFTRCGKESWATTKRELSRGVVSTV
jgi:hypothetical protein